MLFYFSIWRIYLVSVLLGNNRAWCSKTDQKDVKTCNNYAAHEEDSGEDTCAQDDGSPAELAIVCTTGKVIVLKSLLFAVKRSSECTKRISTERFCCKRKKDDVLFDGHCLQDVWNDEDGGHYRTFMKAAIQECMEKQECTLGHSLFLPIQRRLYNNTHSSYFKIMYQCVDDPTETHLLQPNYISKSEKEVILKGTTNATRKCVVRSTAGGMISVQALDIRSSVMGKDSHPELKLKTEAAEKIIRANDLPLFGFQEFISGRKINITVADSMKLWLRIKATDGENVNITCGEPDREPKKLTTTATTGATFGSEGSYSIPLVSAAVSAVITICINTAICGIVFLYRKRCRKGRRKRRNVGYLTAYGADRGSMAEHGTEEHNGSPYYAAIRDPYNTVPDSGGGDHYYTIGKDKAIEASVTPSMALSEADIHTTPSLSPASQPPLVESIASSLEPELEPGSKRDSRSELESAIT